MRKLIATLAALAVIAIPTAALAVPGNGAGGVTGPAIYVDGDLYRTVGTPTDFSGTGAPDASFDTIYAMDEQMSVATAAPGDPGFNGGRWMVHHVSFTDYATAVATYDSNGSGDFDTAAELHAALEAGAAIDDGVVKSFECPVIPLPGN